MTTRNDNDCVNELRIRTKTTLIMIMLTLKVNCAAKKMFHLPNCITEKNQISSVEEDWKDNL